MQVSMRVRAAAAAGGDIHARARTSSIAASAVSFSGSFPNIFTQKCGSWISTLSSPSFETKVACAKVENVPSRPLFVLTNLDVEQRSRIWSIVSAEKRSIYEEPAGWRQIQRLHRVSKRFHHHHPRDNSWKTHAIYHLLVVLVSKQPLRADFDQPLYLWRAECGTPPRTRV